MVTTRTPDEVKKGLEYSFKSCWTALELGDPLGYPQAVISAYEAMGNALDLIQQLEAQNTELSGEIGQLEAERDAAVADLEHVKDCDSCKYDDACFTGKKDCFGCHEKKCPCLTCQYEWRGVQKEG